MRRRTPEAEPQVATRTHHDTVTQKQQAPPDDPPMAPPPLRWFRVVHFRNGLIDTAMVQSHAVMVDEIGALTFTVVVYNPEHDLVQQFHRRIFAPGVWQDCEEVTMPTESEMVS